MHKRLGNLIIFDDGRIYRELKTKCKQIEPMAGSRGYWLISLNGTNMLAHRLIMEAFYGKSSLTVDHLDGNKLNNSLDNLEYVTLSENVKRAYDSGLKANAGIAISKKVLWNGKVYCSAKALSKELGRCDSYASQKIKRNDLIIGFVVKFI